MRRALVLVAYALVVALISLSGPPALADVNPLAKPTFEKMTPAVDGVSVKTHFSAAWEIHLENRTPTEITVIGKTGEPFLRIGPYGVLANFVSPTWYDSTTPSGSANLPPQAQPGASVPPNWKKVSAEPVWGWLDTRLSPAVRFPPAKVIEKTTKPLLLGHWTIPIRSGETSGELRGKVEFIPSLGSYRSVQKSTTTPAPGVKIQVASGSTVPAVFVENLSPEPLVVLGTAGEPFARIGPTATEVNLRSPTWVENEKALSKPVTEAADAKAEPKWEQIAASPRWSWLEFRAAAPKEDPPEKILRRSSVTTIKEWRVPFLIGEKRDELVGETQFVPIARIRQESSGRTSGGGGNGKLYSLVGGFVTVAVAGFFGRRTWQRRRGARPVDAQIWGA